MICLFGGTESGELSTKLTLQPITSRLRHGLLSSPSVSPVLSVGWLVCWMPYPHALSRACGPGRSRWVLSRAQARPSPSTTANFATSPAQQGSDQHHHTISSESSSSVEVLGDLIVSTGRYPLRPGDGRLLGGKAD